MKDFSDYSLLSHNTFGIAARCNRFIEFCSADEACEVARCLSAADSPLLIIGGGSNLLLTRDFPGIVVRSAIKGIEVLQADGDEVLVRVGSGETWDDVVAHFVRQGWYGAENLSLIPGDVGASAVQNIGAYGVEACDLIRRVEAVRISDARPLVILAADCDYGYRQSRFKREWRNQYLITHVVYRLSKRFEPRLDYGNIRFELMRRSIVTPTAEQLRSVIIDIRREKLPDTAVEGNAGSFFMNPVVGRRQFESLLAQYPDMPHFYIDEQHEKIPAGWMIDQCGWKGRSLGRAGVHDRQALVLVNRGGATGQDVVRLCEAIRSDVFQKFGIEITPEVNII